MVGLPPAIRTFTARHVIKMSATTYLSSGWRLGWSVQFSSGLSYSQMEPSSSGSTLPPGYFGSVTPIDGLAYPTGRRNDLRNEPFWTVDARVQREWSMRSVRCDVSVDAFNLLDDDTIRILDVSSGVPNMVRRSGKTLQLGFRVAF